MSLVSFHSKLRVLLDNINNGRPINIERTRIPKTAFESIVANRSNQWFGVQELLGVAGVGPKIVQSLVGESYESRVVDSVLYYQKCLDSPGVHGKMRDLIQQLPKADMFCMECQSHRINMYGGFTSVSVHLKVTEMALFASLMGISSCVSTVNPSRISGYFDYKANGKLQKKKQAAISHTNAMFLEKRPTPFGNVVTVSDKIFKEYLAIKKKDDFSDAMLQAVAVMEWREMYEGLINST